MGKELLKGMKRCSKSTDAEASDHKDKKSLQIAESELQSTETDVKKQKKRKNKSKSKQIVEDENTSDDNKEMKKLRKSFKEMTETMKNLQDFFMAKPDPPGMSLKDLLVRMVPVPVPVPSPEEPPKKLETYECCFETEDADGDRESIFVHGFDTSLARDDIKTALREYFESGGLKVSKVFVPIECQTGVPLGFAFVDVDDDQKALRLRGGLVRGRMLHVLMAQDQIESCEFPNFTGCEHCGFFLRKRRAERYRRYRRYLASCKSLCRLDE